MPARLNGLSVAWRMAFLYLSGLLASLIVIGNIAPHFTYTLDDAYIHLALAQHIAEGHYGINAGEVTSPSSSVLWPFLLAPFSHSAIRYWAPLIYNLLFSLMNCWLISGALEGRLDRVLRGGIARWCFAGLLVLSANMFCLTLTGMEHSLQVTAALGSGIAILRMYEGRRASWPLLSCAAIAPAIRYEDLLFTLAVASTLWLRGRRATAALTLLLSLVPLLLLALFLHAHGLPPLPNSVLSKGGVITARPHLFAHHLMLDHILAIAAVNVIGSMTQPERWPVDVLVVLFAVLLYRQREQERTLLLPALVASVLMVLFGPYGWFYRYDVCLRVFLLLFVLYLLLSGPRPVSTRLLWSSALAAASVYAVATLRAPFACQAIAMQQYQMHRFTHDFAKTNVAVNDLGLVAMDADSRYYILDLIGLASSEALNAKVRDAAWASTITRRHDVRLVMVYPNVLTGIPADWIALGDLRNAVPALPPLIPAYRVCFYATHAEDVAALRGKLSAFQSTLQPGTWFVEAQR